MRRLSLLTIFLTSLAYPTPAKSQDELFGKQIQPLLNKYCTDCHGGAKPKARLRLDSPNESLPTALKDLKRLDRIAERIRTQTMPPSDHKLRPNAGERSVLVNWLNSRIDVALGDVSNPGRVTIRRLTKVDYRNTIRDLLGVEIDTSDFPSDDIAHGFDNLADVISLPPVLMDRYADAAEVISKKWFDQKIGKNLQLWPTKAKPGHQFAKELLLPIMQRAFRRPLVDTQKENLLAFYRSCESKGFGYRGSMEASLQYILLSPRFLYRIEEDGPIGQDRAIDDFELASRLSYFLWSTMPDEQLWNLAQKGQLQKEDQLNKQIHRMLSDPKVRDGLVENFAGQWLQTRRLELIGPDKKTFPNFDPALQRSMKKETHLVFEKIIRENLPITELLKADWTFLNGRLARHYGIKGVEGETFRQVSLIGLPRRGILTHSSILALTSNPTRTSPVKRGRWILEAILGTPPPPPVADAGSLEAVKLSGTLRQRLEQHRSNPRCASCHNRMDPLGLAFENFDAIGAWRSKDNGRPIDASGKLPDGATFKNANELIELLANRYVGQFRKNLAKQMLIYALGRNLERYDRKVVHEIEQRMLKGGDRFNALVLAIVDSDPFRKRRNPDQIGIAGLPPEVAFDLKGNPDQQMILKLRPRQGAKKPAGPIQFEVHSLKPLLRAIAGQSKELKVASRSVKEAKLKVFRYPFKVAMGEPLRLFFIPGLIAPGEYSDDFLMPITPIPETDQNVVMKVAHWNQRWGAGLVGPVNPRPGTIYSFDFDVRLVAKDQDDFDVWINIGGAHNRSVFAAGPRFKVKGEGQHRLTRVGRRTANMGGAWANDISVLIRTHAQTVIGNFSPIRFIRPKLGISNKSPIDLGTVGVNKGAESKERKIYNAQQKALPDHLGQTWNTILYGTSRLFRPDKQRQYMVETKHVGIELMGKEPANFELVGPHLTANKKGIVLTGQDKKVGLEGGKQPEYEPFQVRFLGGKKAGTYEAAVRVVTQAGRVGMLSQGKSDEPERGLYYIDIPVQVKVK